VTNDGTLVHLENQRGDLKRQVEFVVEPTGQKKSGEKNDHIGRPLYSFIDRHCPSLFVAEKSVSSSSPDG
jgi:hypothetical protein